MLSAVLLMGFGGSVAAVFTYFVVRRIFFLKQELHDAVDFLKKESASGSFDDTVLQDAAKEHFMSTMPLYTALAAVGWVAFILGAIRYNN